MAQTGEDTPMEDVPESQVGESEAGDEVEEEKKLFQVRAFVAFQAAEETQRPNG